MAFWGYPEVVPDVAERACRCALEATRRISERRVQWEKEGLPQLNFRIGISSGTVLVGNSGSSSRFNYTVLGSPVNLAARLEPLNKVFGTRILVSESIHEATEDTFVTRRLGPCRIKGFENPMPVYQLLSEIMQAPVEIMQASKLWSQVTQAVDSGNVESSVEFLDLYVKAVPSDQFAVKALEKARESKALPELSATM